MKIIELEIVGAYLIDNFRAEDARGSFEKIYNKDSFAELGLETVFCESYYSCSTLNVIRGMHVQLPPNDHVKLVHLFRGEAIDVIFDMRKASRTYGKAIGIHLSEGQGKSIYIPRGCAHGFKSLSNDTMMIYHVSTVYNREADTGIRYDSIGYDWDCGLPVMSERDRCLSRFEEFENPF